MKTKRQTQPSPVAENQYIEDNLARRDWQGNASVELVLAAAELGVLWPPSRGVGKDTDLVLGALNKIEACKNSDSTTEAAYTAGRAVEAVVCRLAEFKKRAQGSAARAKNKTSNHAAFYAIADRLVAQGKELGAAHLRATKELSEYQKRLNLKKVFSTPSLSEFATHLNRNKKRGV